MLWNWNCHYHDFLLLGKIIASLTWLCIEHASELVVCISKVLFENMSQSYFGCNLIPLKQDREWYILQERCIRQDLGKEGARIDPGPSALGVWAERVLPVPTAICPVVGRRTRRSWRGQAELILQKDPLQKPSIINEILQGSVTCRIDTVSF